MLLPCCNSHSRGQHCFTYDTAGAPTFGDEEVPAIGTVSQAASAAATDASTDHSTQPSKKRKMSNSDSGTAIWSLQAAHVLTQHLWM